MGPALGLLQSDSAQPPLQRQSTGLKQTKLMISKMSDKTYAKKVAAAEKKLKRITAKVVASTKGLVREAAHYREVKNTCIGAFVVFNHEESWRRCVTDYNKPHSIFGMLLCRGQPQPLRFRSGQGYKDPYGRSATPGTVRNLLEGSENAENPERRTAAVSARRASEHHVGGQYPEGYSKNLDEHKDKRVTRLGDTSGERAWRRASSVAPGDGDTVVDGGAPAGALSDEEKKPALQRGASTPPRTTGGEVKATTIKVTRADRPGNVLWENIETSKKEIFLRKALTKVVAVGLLLVCGATVSYIKMAYVNVSGKVPTVEICDNVLPRVYYATTETLDPPELVRKDSDELCKQEGICQSSCPEGTHWVSYESAPFKWRHPDTNRSCTHPCLSEDASHDDMDCRGDDGKRYSFSRGDVLGCFCMQRLAALTEEEGLLGGAQAMLRDHRDLCGDFAWTYVSKKVGSILTAGATVVINEALKAAIQFLGDLERNKTVTQRTISVTLNIFFCLFINTAVVVVMVNAQFDASFMNSMGFLEDLGKDGETDYSSAWYRSVGFPVVSTMFINCFSPHAAPLSKLITEPIKRCIYTCTGRPMTQFEMNKHYEPPVFKLEQRAAQVCNTIAVTLAFSPGLPILIPIATLSLSLSYALDKYLLLRLYRRPPAYNAELPLRIVAMIPFMIYLHLGNAAVFYANQEVFESVFFSRSEMGLDAVAPYESGSYESDFYEDHPLVAAVLDRVWRANVVPLIVVLAVCVTYNLAHQSISTLFFVLAKYVPCFASCADTGVLARKAHNPPYTELYERFYQKKGGFCAGVAGENPGAPTMPADRGWVTDYVGGGGVEGGRKSNIRGYYRISKEVHRPAVGEVGKLRAHDDFWGTGEGLIKGHGEPQLTWEVVSETGCGSYQMNKNPRYQEIVLAREALNETLADPRRDDSKQTEMSERPGTIEKAVAAFSKVTSICFPPKVIPDPTMGGAAPKEVHIEKRVKQKKGAFVAHVKKRKSEAMYDEEKIKQMGDGSALRNKLV